MIFFFIRIINQNLAFKLFKINLVLGDMFEIIILKMIGNVISYVKNKLNNGFFWKLLSFAKMSNFSENTFISSNFNNIGSNIMQKCHWKVLREKCRKQKKDFFLFRKITYKSFFPFLFKDFLRERKQSYIINSHWHFLFFL